MEPTEKNQKRILQHSLLAKYVSSFFISLFFSLIIALIIFVIAYFSDSRLLTAIKSGETGIAGVDFAKPESRELYSYAAFFLFFALSFVSCCTFLDGKLQRLFVFTDKLLTKHKKATVICCFTGIIISFGLLSIYFRRYGIVLAAVTITILALFFLLYDKKKPAFDNTVLFIKKREKTFKAVALALCGLLFVFVLFFYFCTNNFSSFGAFHHFSAYYYSVFDVYNGGVLLINTNSIYGFYAYLLMPYFKLFGLSLVSFSVLVLILTAVILICVFYILNTVTKNYFYVLLGFFGFVGYMFFYGMSHDGFLYLQYLPHRTLAPIVMLAHMCRLSKKDRQGIINITIGYALSLFFLLWNMETGIVSLIVYCLFIIYMKAKNCDKICKRLLIAAIKYFTFGILTFISSIVLMILITFLKSGAVINVFSLFGLVGQGYFMLPLPAWPHIYMVIILIYMIALSVGIFQLKLASQKENTNSAILFVISIFGILSFVYYLGRSHDYNLTPCTWPCIFLCVYFLDYSQKKKKAQEPCDKNEAELADENSNACITQKTKNGKGSLMPCLRVVLICVLVVVGAFTIIIPAQNKLTQNYISTKTVVSADFVQNKGFIESCFQNEDSLFIVSQNSALYLTEIKKDQKFKYKSSCDWITVQDYENALLIISEISEDFIISDDILDSLEKYCPEKYQNIFDKFEIKAESGNKLENLILYCLK